MAIQSPHMRACSRHVLGPARPLRAALLVVLWLALLISPAAAGKLRVRGAAVIDARTVVLPEGFEVRGNVRDDAGRPLGPTHVRMRVTGMSDQVRLPKAGLCPPTPEVHEARGFSDLPDEYVIDTNAAGAFCVRVDMPLADATIELEMEGTRDVDGGKTKLELDSAKRALLLQFTPEPRTLSLDQKSELFAVDTRVQPSLPETAELVELTLTLTDRSQPGAEPREIGKAAVRAGDRARFEVETRLLERPGPAVLRVRFAGSRTLAASEKNALIERTARVELKPPAPLPEVDPSSGVELDVAVTSSQGPVASGSVEALSDGQTVGTAPVKNGRATVVADFQVAHGDNVVLTLRYLPGAPWWLPGPPLQLTLPLRPPSPWRRVPWIIAALAIGGWIMRGWWRPKRIVRNAEPRPVTSPTGAAALELVEVGAAHSGWRGVVMDAHEGHAIAFARVAVEEPSFAAAPELSAETDAEGRFSIEAPARRLLEGTRLRVTAASYSVLERPAPPQGQVAIQLVSRRRALLDALVHWARRRGAPWAGSAEPTPGHVARVALRRDRGEVAEWAANVEDAAYGPVEPDDQRERRLRETEPT